MANRKRFYDKVFSGDGIVCHGPEETLRLGEEFAAWARDGAVFSLEGPLGAGKTQFVKGLARGLGVQEEATSPTFTLVHEYSGGRPALVHFDFYRLESAEELRTPGFDDYLGQGVLAIEWGDKFPHILPV